MLDDAQLQHTVRRAMDAGLEGDDESIGGVEVQGLFFTLPHEQRADLWVVLIRNVLEIAEAFLGGENWLSDVAPISEAERWAPYSPDWSPIRLPCEAVMHAIHGNYDAVAITTRKIEALDDDEERLFAEQLLLDIAFWVTARRILDKAPGPGSDRARRWRQGNGPDAAWRELTLFTTDREAVRAWMKEARRAPG